MLIGGKSGITAAGKYKLTAPAAIRDYTLKSKNNSAAGTAQTGFNKLDGSLVATYTKGSEGTDTITVGGSYGSNSDPGALISQFGSQLTSSGKMTWKTPLASVPAANKKDPGAKMECGVATTSGFDFPICAWADHSTWGAVTYAHISLNGSVPPRSQDDAAAETRLILGEAEVAK